MADQIAGSRWRDFAGEFVQEMMNALGRPAGRSWRISIINEQISDAPSEAVWVDLAFTGGIKGDCVLGLSRADTAALVADLSQRDNQEATKNGEAETLSAAIAGIAEELAAAASDPYGAFSLTASAREGFQLADKIAVEVRLHDDHSLMIAMIVCASAELMESLNRSLDDGAEAQNPLSSDAAIPLPASLFSDAPNLDLVMDVELDVTLRFGQRHLTLREVLDLTSGSVVELDRQVDEPVELILDGKVIARGEAVVIDGNYGLRVIDVPHPFATRQPRI